jgi:hypothetical protein
MSDPSGRGHFREFIKEHAGSLPPPPNPTPAIGLPVPPGLLPPVPPQLLPKDPAPAGTMPEFKRASQIDPARIKLPALLIDGLLHVGCKMLLAGGSKSFKSWCLIDMAISLAAGLKWWGLQCKPGLVLYLNFEIIEGFFDTRIVSICGAKQTTLPDNLIIWNLRGHCYDLQALAKVLAARLAALNAPIAAIFVDPIYKALGDLDENSASDMTMLMNLIETFALPTGAAVIFGGHFAKGNASAKEAKDRPSGSGVLIRDPDVILTLTRHKEEDCYTVDSELRYLARLPQFVVRWTFPIMTADESLDPRQLWQPGKPGESGQEGGEEKPSMFTEADVLECLPRTGAQDTLWRKMVALKFGRTGDQYYTAKAKLLAAKLVVKTGQKYYHSNLNLQHPI